MTSDRPARRALAVGAVLALAVLLATPAPAAVIERAAPADAGQGEAPGGAALGPRGACASTPGVGDPVAEADRDRPGDDDRAQRDADSDRRLVHLVTGQTVAVNERGGERSFEVLSGGPVDVVSTNDRTYLLPAGLDPGTYDRSLFDVDALLAARETGGGLPVLLRTNASAASIDAPGLRNVRRLESAGVVAAELDPASADARVAELVDDGLVRGLSLDRPLDGPAGAPVSTAPTPSRPREHTGEGVTVAVLDTGIDATHPDLRERVVDQVDLVDGDPSDEHTNDGGDPGDGDANDDGGDGSDAEGEDGANATNGIDVAPDANGHGTHVAGVVAGTGDDEGAHAGVAPGADLVDVRVMNDRGAGRASTIIEGIEYAVERDVDVILLSVGTSIDGSDEIAASVEWATERGVVVVAAAGNRGRPRTIGAPGRPGGAITVGATDGRGSVASYSSRGPTLDGHLKPDLVAPGGGIVGPLSSSSDRGAVGDDGRYTRMSGTSAAAPRVAGAAALLLSAEPELTAREVEARLASAARPVDGGGAFAQGSGEVDVEAALDPDVVVSDPVVDFGLLDTGDVVNRTIAVTNHDDRRHELTFEVSVRNVDLGVDATGTASLNRTGLSLGPGERADLTLSVDGNTASGAHAGEIRYSVAGEPRSVAFGFVRGGKVTVEKRPLTPGARVDGDPLWVLSEEGTHDELLEFENGTASFVAGGGTYVLWSWGTDEPTGTTAFLSERRVFDGPERLVFDEADTVPVGVDAGPIVDVYGPLSNLTATASMSTRYGDDLARLAVSRQDVERREVRVSRDPQLDVAVTYLLAPEAADSAALDVADVFQIGHGVHGVHGPSTVEVGPDRLLTAEHHLHRTTVDETYRVQDRMSMDGIWNQIDRRWFDVGGRTTQRVHRYPAGATYHRAFRGPGWNAHRESRGDADAGASADVLSHPMHGLVETFRVEDGVVNVTGVPFSDGDGTWFDPPGVHRVSVSVDGEVVRDERTQGGRGSIEGLAVEPGADLAVRIVGEDPDGRLSTRTLTEVVVPDYRPVDDGHPVAVNRPPIVSNVSIRGADAANAVEPGAVTAVFDVDAVGPVTNPTVWYAAGRPEAPPWRNRSGWERAETEPFGGRLLATFDVAAEAETVSLAAEFGDIRGHRTRTMTVDAAHVGEAPNTSTSMLTGRLLAADGSPAANDTVVVAPGGDGSNWYVSTGGDGRFAVELPRGRDYDLTYLRGEPWTASAPTADGRPAWLPLSRAQVDEDVDLGVLTLPPARTVTVHVTDERGEPVPGASVRVSGRSGNVSASEVLETGEGGLARRQGNERVGIDLAGPVEVTVDPPEGDLYPAQVHRRNLTAAEAATVNVTVRTAPPEAVLTAFGHLEPGAVLFLEARKSDVPAGVAEYRWDLDGDGATDRVTEDPNVRYVPQGRTVRAGLTVVDRAGKTDSSTLAFALDGD